MTTKCTAPPFRPWVARLLLATLVHIAVVAANEEINLGTTLVALKYQDGVVVGADTRTSVSGYVSNKFAKKINVIVDQPEASCVICRSGSAADTQWLAKQAKEQFEARQWRYQFHQPSVSQVAHFLRQQMRSQSDLQASLICAGFDEEGGRIFGIAPGGSMWEEETFCVSGSGSTFLLGHLDSLKLDRTNLYTEEQAIELVTKLLGLSISRDGSSGGMIRLMVLKPGGVEELTVYPDSPIIKEIRGFAKPAFTGTTKI